SYLDADLSFDDAPGAVFDPEPGEGGHVLAWPSGDDRRPRFFDVVDDADVGAGPAIGFAVRELEALADVGLEKDQREHRVVDRALDRPEVVASALVGDRLGLLVSRRVRLCVEKQLRQPLLAVADW